MTVVPLGPVVVAVVVGPPFNDALAAVVREVCGRVKSSKWSAKRGWCMCRYVEEESLDCSKSVDWVE